jgi:hypothetical protein
MLNRIELTHARAPGYRAAGVTRAEYENARHLVRDNGRQVLRILPERVRRAMLAELAESQAEKINHERGAL